MFLWDITSVGLFVACLLLVLIIDVQPERDGALENDIVVHENTHGVTNRMTGGGTGRCLQTTEAGGMGEGTMFQALPFGPILIPCHPRRLVGRYGRVNHQLDGMMRVLIAIAF